MEGFTLPPRKKLSEFLNQETASTPGKGKNVFAKGETRTPRKGKCWTEEEHLAFLAGLTKLGKGNWTGISRYYVPTRTSTQIASHAQKYLQRVAGATKRKSRFTDIEQQVLASGLAEDLQPVWPLPDTLAGTRTARSAPAGLESSPPASSSSGTEEGSSRSFKIRRVSKPIPVRASSTEPDLETLAESLISLSDPSRRSMPSSKSAFKQVPVRAR